MKKLPLFTFRQTFDVQIFVVVPFVLNPTPSLDVDELVDANIRFERPFPVTLIKIIRFAHVLCPNTLTTPIIPHFQHNDFIILISLQSFRPDPWSLAKIEFVRFIFWTRRWTCSSPAPPGPKTTIFFPFCEINKFFFQFRPPSFRHKTCPAIGSILVGHHKAAQKLGRRHFYPRFSVDTTTNKFPWSNRNKRGIKV